MRRILMIVALVLGIVTAQAQGVKVTSRYKPLTYDEIMAPAQAATNAHIQAENQVYAWLEKVNEYYSKGEYANAELYLNRCIQLNARWNNNLIDNSVLLNYKKQIEEAKKKANSQSSNINYNQHPGNNYNQSSSNNYNQHPGYSNNQSSSNNYGQSSSNGYTYYNSQKTSQQNGIDEFKKEFNGYVTYAYDLYGTGDKRKAREMLNQARKLYVENSLSLTNAEINRFNGLAKKVKVNLLR